MEQRRDVIEPEQFKPGDLGEYHEDGEILLVQVLENRTTKEQEFFMLEVVGVEKESGIIKPNEKGSIFDCRQNRKFSGQRCWTLYLRQPLPKKQKPEPKVRQHHRPNSRNHHDFA